MRKIFLTALLPAIMLTACDETTDTLGGSLTNASDMIRVEDATFAVTTSTALAPSVLSRSATGYLGRVKDPETGAYVKSDFLTQFHVPENYAFPDITTMAHGLRADSCDLRLFLDKYYGDSLTTMHATLWELSRPIEEDKDYYSSLDPVAEGFVRIAEGAVKSGKAFSLVNTNVKDSVRYAGSYTNNILFTLNAPYTDTQGRSYSNYGSYILERYHSSPDDFKNSYTFSHRVCPGFWVELTGGLGCMAQIRSSQLNVYYTKRDSIDHATYNSFAGTEEVRQLTRITSAPERLLELARDPASTYVKSPAGLVTELLLPVEEVYEGHEGDSINSARIALTRIMPEVSGEYALPAPETLLMVEKSQADDFFRNGEIANYRTSFVAPYSSSSNSYVFGNIGQLIKHLYDKLPADPAEREAWKQANPDWNRVVLLPVKASYVAYQNQSILSAVTGEMSLASVRLVGGGNVSMTVIYSKFDTISN